MTSRHEGPRIIVALDFPTAAQALKLVDSFDPTLCRLKVGKELFTAAGPELVRTLVGRGYDVFLDLKFHDIPNTVAQACAAAAELGVWMLNVHALGGRKMMQAAREAVDKTQRPPLLIAVTVLTSLGDDELREVGLPGTAQENVSRLAALAQSCGLDGVVCSAQEAQTLRRQCGDDFCLVTPGIRPRGSEAGDQQRIMTPREALQNGASYLVIGRPVTHAPSPKQSLLAIHADLQE